MYIMYTHYLIDSMTWYKSLMSE